MSVYVIAQISITDRASYNKYQARFLEVFQKFKGQLLAADEKPEVIEGDWNREKVVLMKFPDKESFEAWAYSPEYQEIAKDRKAGSEGVFLLVKSFDL
ncbi:MAG TPA: DUF1330 domain-containing protein [Pyrinomonadaceae bacterium]|nr:DUF1330 domain-containing protein [Pyrinomonadaceae bacterium]